MIIGIEAQRLFRRKKHGMEIVALEIIRQLQQIDRQNTYILFAKNDEDPNCIPATANFTVDHVSDAAYPLWEQVQLPKAIKKAAPDVLHCTANTAPLRCKIPMVITIHDVIYLESVSFSGSSYQNFGNLYRRFIVPRVAKKAAIIITVSEYEKNIIAERLHIPKEKIRVVYNGANAQFKPVRDKAALEAFREQYSLPEKFLLHFGNTAPKKNTIGVLQAHKLYTESVNNPIPLVLTDCSKEYIASLLNQIQAADLVKHIRILDYVPFINIPLLYNLATVFLYPSHRESFGMPVIESMACGTPVITSNYSALPEIAGGAACLVDSKNPVEICGYINQLLTDSTLYNNRREAGFVNAAKFSWTIAAEKTLAIYNELNK